MWRVFDDNVNETVLWLYAKSWTEPKLCYSEGGSWYFMDGSGVVHGSEYPTHCHVVVPPTVLTDDEIFDLIHEPQEPGYICDLLLRTADTLKATNSASYANWTISDDVLKKLDDMEAEMYCGPMAAMHRTTIS